MSLEIVTMNNDFRCFLSIFFSRVVFLSESEDNRLVPTPLHEDLIPVRSRNMGNISDCFIG